VAEVETENYGAGELLLRRAGKCMAAGRTSSETAMEGAEKYALAVGGIPRPDGAAPSDCAWDASTGEWVSLDGDDEPSPRQVTTAPPPSIAVSDEAKTVRP